MHEFSSRGKVRRFAAAAVVTAVAGAGMIVAADAPAQAAALCSGTEIDHATLTDAYNGAAEGTLYVYYNSSTGHNCAYATNGTGVRHTTFVWIERCKSGTGKDYDCDYLDTLTQGKNYDLGSYISYAGPVNTLGSASGLCIEAYGEIDYGNSFATADIEGHCG